MVGAGEVMRWMRGQGTEEALQVRVDDRSDWGGVPVVERRERDQRWYGGGVSG